MRRHICIENYTVREVLMKTRTGVKFGEIFIIPECVARAVLQIFRQTQASSSPGAIK
jgi:hypothetical protein